MCYAPGKETDQGPNGILKREEQAMSTATASSLATGSWTIDRVHSHVGFAVKHMVVSTFRGRFEEYDGALRVGEDGAPRLEGRVAVESIAVADENLAAHLSAPDFFDSERYPEIRFTSSAVRLREGGEVEVEGDLQIKDRTRRVLARG